MRTETLTSSVLTYPDKIGFAFNPCLFMVKSGGKTVSYINVQLSDGTNTAVAYSNAFGGTAYIDVREYVQSYFDDISEELAYGDKAVNNSSLGREFTATVTVGYTDATTETFTATIFYVWAALAAGGKDVYNGFRTLTYFKGYPFTMGVYADEAGALLFKRDGVATDNVELGSKGVFNVALPSAINPKKYILVCDWDGKFGQTTFDNTFDMTFRYTTGSKYAEKIRIVLADTNYDGSNSVYLRWVNRHGVYCYWLFKRGAQAYKTATDGEFVRNNLLSWDQSYGYQHGAGHQMGYTRQDTVPLCAPLVDSDTWDFLFDLCTSPLVDMFCGWQDEAKTKANWLSVNVVAGSFTKAIDELQDFILQINLPETPLQSL